MKAMRNDDFNTILKLKMRGYQPSENKMCIRDRSYPVGKVNVINIFPMNFEEFLVAKGEEEACKSVSYTHLDVYKRQHESLLLFVGNVRHMDRMQLLAEQEQVFSDKRCV